ncbi:PI-actitoxin-Aeq3b [Anabrus simplex]|uniref:PI-actitoxin-Aeq3b n=1 Tax=Anabrus simplex TaxID=316456 RepID=UPI0035A2F258
MGYSQTCVLFLLLLTTTVHSAIPLANVCNLPPVTGNCMGYFPSFYFARNIGECQRFIYGGCGGNANRFLSRRECEERCLRKRRL